MASSQGQTATVSSVMPILVMPLGDVQVEPHRRVTHADLHVDRP